MIETKQDRIRRQKREWYQRNKDRKAYWNASYRRQRGKDPKAWNKKSRDYNKRKREELIAALGGKCSRCGIDDHRVLQIDHVNGGGTKDCKKMVGVKNKTILERVLSGSKDYQLLCANCNWIKRHELNETSNKMV